MNERPPAAAQGGSVCCCGGEMQQSEFQGFGLSQCVVCGYARVLLNLSREELVRLYSGQNEGSGYSYSKGRRFVPLISAVRAHIARWRVRKYFHSRLPGPRSVMDFGCGQGYYLDAFRVYGYDSKGIEITEESARFAREKGHKVVLDSTEFPDSCFDLVVSIHVLEHIADLKPLLLQLKRKLRAGATFHFEVPNFGSIQGRCFRFRWFHADLGIHYHLFTVRSLTSLLQSTGFRVTSTEFGSFEQGIMGWVQSMYNIAFPYNRFYRMLFWRRVIDDKKSAWPELLLFPIVLPVSVLLYLIERLTGTGPVIRVEGVVQRNGSE